VSPSHNATGSKPHRQAAVGKSRIAAVIAVLALIAIVVIQVKAERLGGIGPRPYRLLTLILIWQALALVAAALLKWVRPRKLAGALIIASLLILPAASLTRGSQISDDLYRYAWDGRLQAAGVDPYRYPPAAPELKSFRDSWLWPDVATCVKLNKKIDASNPEHACTRINRPLVRTIYPPAAEGYFLLAHVLPGPARDHKLQLDAALLSAALVGLLAFGLRRTGRDPLTVAYYSFGPLAGLDIAGDAHVDVLAAIFGVGAVLLATLKPKATARVGLLLGLAIATKLYPALLFPALLNRAGGRRGALKLVAAAAGIVLVGYLPHVIAVGPHVLGYLPGYLHEEKYDSGTRFLIIGLLGLGDALTKFLAVAVLLAAVVTIGIQSARGALRPAMSALLLFGAAFLVATPTQTWYSLLLVSFAIIAGRFEWLALAIAPYPLYVTTLIHGNGLLAGRLSYGVAATIVLAFSVARTSHKSQNGNNDNPTSNRLAGSGECPITSSPQPTSGHAPAGT
jgi:hypothetical protein